MVRVGNGVFIGKDSSNQHSTSCSYILLIYVSITWLMLDSGFQIIRVLASRKSHMEVPMGYTTPPLLGEGLGEMG